MGSRSKKGSRTNTLEVFTSQGGITAQEHLKILKKDDDSRMKSKDFTTTTRKGSVSNYLEEKGEFLVDDT